MSVERIKWKMNGFRELRKSREVMADLIKRGDAIVTASGPGYDKSPYTGRNRARVSVTTDTRESEMDNATRNTLINNLNAGR